MELAGEDLQGERISLDQSIAVTIVEHKLRVAPSSNPAVGGVAARRREAVDDRKLPVRRDHSGLEFEEADRQPVRVPGFIAHKGKEHGLEYSEPEHDVFLAELEVEDGLEGVEAPAGGLTQGGAGVVNAPGDHPRPPMNLKSSTAPVIVFWT